MARTKRKETSSAKRFVKIDFRDFRTGNVSPQDAFEALSYNLFCRKHKISAGLGRYKNQPGLETEPFVDGKKVIGWQAKFFEQQKIDYTQFKQSIEKAKENHQDLTDVVLYTNLDETKVWKKKNVRGRKKNRPTERENFKKKAAALGLNLEWVTLSNLQILLDSPQNLDLANFYFGGGDTFGFLNSQVHTFLQSKELLCVNLMSFQIENT